MQRTTNYNLKKPEYSDSIDVADFNANADTIDAKLKENADAVSVRYVKPTNGIPETDLAEDVRAKLNASESAIIIGMETEIFGAAATFGNYTIDGETATASEVGAAIFSAYELNTECLINLTETDYDGEGTHNNTIFHLNDIYGGNEINYIAHGFRDDIYIINIQRVDGAFFILPNMGNWKESTANKVTSLSASSTDRQYPSAKCVYNAIKNAGGIELTTDGTSIKKGTITQTYAQVKSLVENNISIRVTHITEGVYMYPTINNANGISFNSSDGATDFYTLHIATNGTVTYNHRTI